MNSDETMGSVRPAAADRICDQIEK